MMNLISRPARRYLFSSKKSSKPLIMSLPLAVSGPVCGTSMPILMGPFCASDSPLPTTSPATITASTAITSSLRMSAS